MNELKIFENQEFGRIRVVKQNGEPWFVGKDVAGALGYSNTKDAISSHIDAEDKRIIQRSEIATVENHIPKSAFPINFVSGDIPNRGLTIINESGLYSLILSSKLPTAKQFKRWVTSEVLPAIRRTGSYSAKYSQQNDENKRKNAEARLMNARTRMSDQFLKLMNVDTLSREYKNILVAKAAEVLAGEPVLSLPKSHQKTHSAKEIGELFGISANKVGRLANLHGLKVSEYGEYYRSKSEYSNKEVDTWVYYDSVIPVLAQLLGRTTA